MTEVDNAIKAQDAARAIADGGWKRFPELNPVHGAASIIKGGKSSVPKIQRSTSARSLKNDEGDSSCKDTSCAAGGGAASGKASAKSDPVEAHVTNLCLDEVLTGKKKGVALYHAREAKLKLSQEKQIVLGNHIRLVTYAQKLTPSTVSSTPSAELEDFQVCWEWEDFGFAECPQQTTKVQSLLFFNVFLVLSDEPVYAGWGVWMLKRWWLQFISSGLSLDRIGAKHVLVNDFVSAALVSDLPFSGQSSCNFPLQIGDRERGVLARPGTASLGGRRPWMPWRHT